MRIPKLLRWLIWTVAGLAAFVLCMVLLLAFVQIPIDLTSRKDAVEWTTSRFLGRQVDIDGKMRVNTSLWPSFYIEGLRIGNPEGFQNGDFAHMKSAKITVGVLPLLQWKVHIREFSVKGLTVAFLENDTGAVNWLFRTPRNVSSKTPTTEAPHRDVEQPEDRQLHLTSESFVLKKLAFENISASYRQTGMADPFEFTIDTCTGSAPAGETFTMALAGTLLNESFRSSIQMGSLQELLEKNQSWGEVKLEIAGTLFEWTTHLDLSRAAHQLNLKASVSGDRLDSLNELLKLDLPPLESYRAKAHLTAKKHQIELTDIELSVGTSKLTGKMTLKKTDGLPEASVALTSPLVQLDDFAFDNWSYNKGRLSIPDKLDLEALKKTKNRVKKGSSDVAAKFDTVADKPVANLISPEVLARLDARITITAENVMSGNDKLGSGLITAELKSGRLSVDPIKLNLPGGSFLFGASFKPGAESSDASVKVSIKNFDIGVMARRRSPDTKMGGTLNLDVNLKSSARSVDDLLSNASGYIDFSGHPVALKAGILDLWAVNVIAAISSSVESKNKGEPSKINCIIGRWSAKDGILNSDVFVIDTSKIRICGEGRVNFKKDLIELKVAPTPKTPEVFSLATPLAVNGKFSDFKMGIESGGLVGTGIRFVTGPITHPLRMFIVDKLPEDGSDICSMPIGKEDRSEVAVIGCKGYRGERKYLFQPKKP